MSTLKSEVAEITASFIKGETGDLDTAAALQSLIEQAELEEIELIVQTSKNLGVTLDTPVVKFWRKARKAML